MKVKFILTFTIICFDLYNTALEHLETSRTAILSCIELPVGALTGILIFHEDHSLPVICGMALVLAAIALLNLMPDIKNNN